MNRRQRRDRQRQRQRAQRRRPAPPPGVLDAVARCPDCDSEVSIAEITPGVYRGEVAHDETCPWFAGFKANGGQGVRFY